MDCMHAAFHLKTCSETRTQHRYVCNAGKSRGALQTRVVGYAVPQVKVVHCEESGWRLTQRGAEPVERSRETTLRRRMRNASRDLFQSSLKVNVPVIYGRYSLIYYRPFKKVGKYNLDNKKALSIERTKQSNGL
jgi:hypothetical protein